MDVYEVQVYPAVCGVQKTTVLLKLAVCEVRFDLRRLLLTTDDPTVCVPGFNLLRAVVHFKPV